MRPVNLTKARATAFKLAKIFDFPHPNEVPLEDLAMFRNVLVIEGGLSGAEGRLIRKKGSGVIRVRERIRQEGRRRFTIAHELGHWELHEGCSQFLCSEDDMRDYGRSPMEREANCFAAELLMPTGYFRPRCQAEPSIALLEDLAREFQTTLTATAIRFAELSRFPIAVVWHEHHTVKWSYSDEKKKLPFVAGRTEVPRFSSARLPEEEVADHMDHYDAADWFPQLQQRKPEVHEMTKRIPSLSAGLTLLWFVDR